MKNIKYNIIYKYNLLYFINKIKVRGLYIIIN